MIFQPVGKFHIHHRLSRYQNINESWRWNLLSNHPEHSAPPWQQKKHCSKHFFIANTSLIFFGKCKNIVFAMFFIQILRSMHNVGVYSSALLCNSNWIKLWMLLWNRAGLFQGKALVWREQRWINPCEHIRIVQGECICAQRDKLCSSHKWMVSTDPFLAKE